MKPFVACSWCAAPTEPTRGVYLEALYPERRICSPCGQLTINCECRRPETEFSAPESEQRALDGYR